MEAFALTGRNYHLYIIARVLPWARSFCPFRAFRCNLWMSLVLLQKLLYCYQQILLQKLLYCYQ